MVPFARRVRTIRMCSLDARVLGPIQATLLKASNKRLRPCWTAFLSILSGLRPCPSPAITHWVDKLTDTSLPSPEKAGQRIGIDFLHQITYATAR